MAHDDCIDIVFCFSRSFIWEEIVKEILIYGSICLFIIYIFILMVLRAVFYVFVLKRDSLESLKIRKPKFTTKKGSLLDNMEKEKQQENNSKWG